MCVWRERTDTAAGCGAQHRASRNRADLNAGSTATRTDVSTAGDKHTSRRADYCSNRTATGGDTRSSNEYG